MIIPFHQNTFSGCASYCLANLFNDKRYIEGIADLKKGEGIADINRKLSIIYPEIFMDYLFVTNSKLKIHPNRLIETLVLEPIWETITSEDKERAARPYFISVKQARTHNVLVIHNLKDNLYYIFDSLLKERFLLTAEELLYYYHILAVEQLFFWDQPDDKNNLFIYKEGFPHLFNPGE